MIFLTQDPGLVDYHYKGCVQQFLRAPEIAYRLSNSIVFSLVDGRTGETIETKYEKVSTKDIYEIEDKKLKVFDFYVSGDNGEKKQKTGNAVKKYFIALPLLAGFIVWSFFNMLDMLAFGTNETEEQPKADNNITTIAPTQPTPQPRKNAFDVSPENETLQRFIFSNDKYYFYDYVLSKETFKAYSAFFNFKVFFYTKTGQNSFIAYIFVPKKYLPFFLRSLDQPKEEKKGIF